VSGTPRHLLDQLISVERSSTSVDSTGFPAITWAAHLSDVPARVQPLDGREAARYERLSNRRTWRVYVAASHDIVETDRILFGAHTLDIREVSDLQSAGRLKRIIAEETDS